ncbi:MAG: DUF4956 domain-containing protein [Bacteroidota bacterium]
MINELAQLDLFPLSSSAMMLNITIALVCGLFISWIYRLTHTGPGYSANFVNSMVLLAMITAIVIMAIGNNLARAFGLVGAMSIIRFRTAVKDTKDIVYIFFSLAIGMATGVGYHMLALTGTLYVSAILFVFSKTKLSVPNRKEYLLQFSFWANGEETPPYMGVLKQYCKKYKVINVKTLGTEADGVEMSYYVDFKTEKKSASFTKALQDVKGVEHINLFFDEERF